MIIAEPCGLKGVMLVLMKKIVWVCIGTDPDGCIPERYRSDMYVCGEQLTPHWGDETSYGRTRTISYDGLVTSLESLVAIGSVKKYYDDSPFIVLVTAYGGDIVINIRDDSIDMSGVFLSEYLKHADTLKEMSDHGEWCAWHSILEKHGYVKV